MRTRGYALGLSDAITRRQYATDAALRGGAATSHRYRRRSGRSPPRQTTFDTRRRAAAAAPARSSGDEARRSSASSMRSRHRCVRHAILPLMPRTELDYRRCRRGFAARDDAHRRQCSMLDATASSRSPYRAGRLFITLTVTAIRLTTCCGYRALTLATCTGDDAATAARSSCFSSPRSPAAALDLRLPPEAARSPRLRSVASDCRWRQCVKPDRPRLRRRRSYRGPYKPRAWFRGWRLRRSRDSAEIVLAYWSDADRPAAGGDRSSRCRAARSAVTHTGCQIEAGVVVRRRARRAPAIGEICARRQPGGARLRVARRLSRGAGADAADRWRRPDGLPVAG